MTFLQNPLILMILLPLIGGLLVLLVPADKKGLVRGVSLGFSLAVFALAVWLLTQFVPSQTAVQFALDQIWFTIAGISIHLAVGLDGINILLVMLTVLMIPLAMFSSWNSVQEKTKAFMAFFLLLEGAMLGVFMAQDLILFYIFWEITLIPMFFLIGLWGGERRIFATLKFFLFTMAGSVLMLAGILYIGIQAGSFGLADILAQRDVLAAAQGWLFAAFAIAFAIKVPLFPFHSWLPDAHVEAPTAGSVILAAVMLKMGTYGFLRFNLPLFPAATRAAAPWMAGLAIVGVLYGALAAYRQKDMKKLVAYSSISHMGFIVLGIFGLSQISLSGAILQMVNHGLSTGALFLIVGMLYERRHTRLMSDFGGLWKVMPVLGTLSLVVILSSAGLPGLNGFIGEFAILQGSFMSPVYGSYWFGGIATLGIILSAVYLLWMEERVFLGPVTHEANKDLSDAGWKEILILGILLVFIFWIGLYPKPFFNLIDPSVQMLLNLAGL